MSRKTLIYIAKKHFISTLITKLAATLGSTTFCSASYLKERDFIRMHCACLLNIKWHEHHITKNGFPTTQFLDSLSHELEACLELKWGGERLKTLHNSKNARHNRIQTPVQAHALEPTSLLFELVIANRAKTELIDANTFVEFLLLDKTYQSHYQRHITPTDIANAIASSLHITRTLALDRSMLYLLLGAINISLRHALKEFASEMSAKASSELKRIRTKPIRAASPLTPSQQPIRTRPKNKIHEAA